LIGLIIEIIVREGFRKTLICCRGAKLSPKEIIEELLPMAANYAVVQGVDLAGQVAAKVAAPVVAGVVSTFADSAPTPYGNDSAPTTTTGGTPITQPGILGIGN